MSSASGHRSRGSDDYGVFDDAKTYYASEERHSNRYGTRTRTYSQVGTIVAGDMSYSSLGMLIGFVLEQLGEAAGEDGRARAVQTWKPWLVVSSHLNERLERKY